MYSIFIGMQCISVMDVTENKSATACRTQASLFQVHIIITTALYINVYIMWKRVIDFIFASYSFIYNNLYRCLA